MQFGQLKRREFITLLGSTAVAWPLGGHAQQAAMPVIGLLAAESPDLFEDRLHAFQTMLGTLGWGVGRNIRIDLRQGDADQAQALAQGLIGGHPDVVVVSSTPLLRAVLRQTRTIPVVFVMVADPVGQGFVASLARPGANVTGFTNFEYAMGGKWVGLLKEIAPDVTRVAPIYNPQTSPGGGSLFLRAIEAAASSFAAEVIATPVRSTTEIEAAITALQQPQGSGVIVLPDVFLDSDGRRESITRLLGSQRVPAIYPFRTFVASGGLISYGVDPKEQYGQAATYVDRILRGAKPADLPVQAPTKFELVINLKTAKALGLDVPLFLQQRADDVIE
jgi:putative tryptophan/tyrosine transport system substrate-binding protein